MLAASRSIHALRDPTRGGLSSTLVEIASRQGLGMEIDEDALPVRDAARGACEMLGRDAVRIGRVVTDKVGRVRLRTPIGGERILELPFGELLPHIC